MLVSLLVMTTAGCTDDGEPVAGTTSSSTIPTPTTLLRVGVEEWPACLNPLTCADRALREQVLQHVLPVAFEITPDNEYRPSPLLASTPEPETVENGVRIVYEIDPAARWADGRPITSSDFLGTWRAIMDTPGADTTGYSRITDIDDADPLRAVVTMSGPLIDWHELFGGATGYVLQADEFGPSTDLTGQFAEALPMSAGPYRLASWGQDSAVLAATEPWEGAEEPPVDQVQLERVEPAELDDPLRYDLLIPAGFGAAVDEDVDAPEGMEPWPTPTTSVLGVWFDQREALLQPAEHRRILDAVLDREDLLPAAGGTSLVTCPGWVPSVGPWCEAATVTPTEPDFDGARFFLAALGWVDDGSGVRVRDGQRFSVPLTHDPTVPGAAELADAVSEALADVSVEARQVEAGTAEWRSERQANESTGIGVFPIDLGFSPRVSDLYGCPDGPPSSVMGACPDELVAAARRLGSTTGDDAREAVEGIAAHVASSVLWIPVTRMRQVSYIRPGRVVTPEETPATGGPLARLHELDVET